MEIIKIILVFLICVLLFITVEKLDILIENSQSWEEFCTENPFECEELI